MDFGLISALSIFDADRRARTKLRIEPPPDVLQANLGTLRCRTVDVVGVFYGQYEHAVGRSRAHRHGASFDQAGNAMLDRKSVV